MWMNGIAPLGYLNKDRTLEIDEENAEKIQHIFQKYIELTSVAKLQESLKEENVFTRTGKPFSKGHLYKILSNKTYIGKIEHKKNVYDGLHESIVDSDIFEKARKILVINSISRKNPTNAKSSSLLAGKLFDDKNNYLSPSHSNTRGKRYRYYVSQAKIQNKSQNLGSITKLPANEIEKFVRDEITLFINKNENIQDYVNNYSITRQKELLKTSSELKPSNLLIRTILHKVIVYKNKVEIILCKDTLVKAIEAITYEIDLPQEKSQPDNLIIIAKSIRLSQADNGAKLIIGGSESTPNHNMALIQAIVKSFYYHKELAEGRFLQKDKNSSYVKKIMELRYLPPKIFEDIMNGKQEKDLTVSKLFSL
jgi:site-specific DNA recombinase